MHTDFTIALTAWLPLLKVQDRDDFNGIARAIDLQGKNVVDHTGQVNSTLPPTVRAGAQHYRNEIRDSQVRVSPVRGLTQKHKGVTAKLFFEASPVPSANSQLSFPDPNAPDPKPAGRPKTKARVLYMIKPYHERITREVSSWMKHPILGWAEMANQAIFHAAGIGHLHQRVHVDEHSMHGGPREPALVVHMEPNSQRIGDAYSGRPPNTLENILKSHPQAIEDAKKIGWMDFLANNLDRHHENLMITADGKLTAIDNGRNFQYIATDKDPGRRKAKAISDTPRNYLSLGALRQIKEKAGYATTTAPHLKNWLDASEWENTAKWWGTVSTQVRQRMQAELRHITDPVVRAHVNRNFNARADVLDRLAQKGVASHGQSDWYTHAAAPLYQPHQKAPGEP